MKKIKLGVVGLLPIASFLGLAGSGGLASGTLITIPTVPVGNPGNAADSIGNGAVGYSYNIGTTDVTAAQYTAFLNAVAATDPNALWNSAMTATTSGGPGIVRSGSSGTYTYSVTGGRGNFPVTYVNFYNTLRFANWLNNGQPTGAQSASTTEAGAYTITSAGISANSITRNAGATWVLESQDEWTKAAYYSPSGGYSLYPDQSNTITTAQANYASTDTTAVGSFPVTSYYGTYDQGGDVYQFNDSIESTSYRGDDGGSFSDTSNVPLRSTVVSYVSETYKNDNVGFRVVELSVPEPASIGMIVAGLTGVLARRRRSNAIA